jgi:hypothetical protein
VDKLTERRMASSGMLRHVALVRTDVSEELSASFIRVTRISELGTTLAQTNNRRTLFLRSVRQLLVTDSVVPISTILVTLMKEALSSSEMSVLTRATRHNHPENAILLFNSKLSTFIDEISSKIIQNNLAKFIACLIALNSR